MDDPGSLEDARRQIDAVDEEIVGLLARRARLAQAVGRLKDDRNQPYFTPERERQIFERLATLDAGPLRSGHVAAVFREIISAARAAEKPLSVAYWGPAGTYSHVAAVQTFGRSTDLVAADSIEEVFRAVEHGRADYGVAPIENSTAGVVPETLDLFPQSDIRICAESFVDVRHVMAGAGVGLEGVRRVYAGPQPANQCRRWLRERLPSAEIVSVAPTVRAAEAAMQDPEGAAIVNSLAVELLGMTQIAERIEDEPNNRTRFVVVGFNQPKPSGHDKTSLVFNLRNRPGELYRVLGAFETNGVNLLMIESRPAQRAGFEYLFYVDCSGHRDDPGVARALASIREMALEATVLGSYPSTDPNLRP